MRRLLFVAVLLLSVVNTGFAEPANIPQQKMHTIEKLLVATGYDRTVDATMKILVKPMLKMMTQSLKRVQPNLSDRALAIIREEILAVMSSEKSKQSLREQICQVYAKIFTTDELRRLVKFYSSPVGKKLAASMPLIIKDSQEITRVWVMTLIPELRRRIRERLETQKLLSSTSNRPAGM